MTSPWALYDELIDAIPADLTITGANTGLRFSRVISSEGGIGIAYTLSWQSRPPHYDGATFVGAGLREIARLAKSWNFAEASVGVAAINAWYCRPDRAEHHGFAPCGGATWRQVFAPYCEAVGGKRVAVIGHFPFAPEALAAAESLVVLERDPLPGDFPDPACEYLLPDCDYVFISSSAFVNKTMPRLLELSRDARVIVLGPSTPLSPILFDHGADIVTGFVSSAPSRLDEALAKSTLTGMHEAGYRVELQAPARTASYPAATVQ